MAGTIQVIEARTKTELRSLVKEWERSVKAAGLEDIRLGYDPERVTRTAGGYSIQVWAHA